jgi:hypothetical protein
MYSELRDTNGIGELANDMVVDVQQLLQQQLALVKVEFRMEVAKLVAAVMALATGIVVAMLGCLLIPFMLAELLLYFTQGSMPVWATFGIVALSLIGIGLLLISIAQGKLSRIADKLETNSN